MRYLAGNFKFLLVGKFEIWREIFHAPVCVLTPRHQHEHQSAIKTLSKFVQLHKAMLVCGWCSKLVCIMVYAMQLLGTL